jgi:hypothetical protein
MADLTSPFVKLEILFRTPSSMINSLKDMFLINKMYNSYQNNERDNYNSMLERLKITQSSKSKSISDDDEYLYDDDFPEETVVKSR